MKKYCQERKMLRRILLLTCFCGVHSFRTILRPRMVIDTLPSRLLLEKIHQHTVNKIIINAELDDILSITPPTDSVQETKTHPLITTKIIEEALQNNIQVDIAKNELEQLASIAGFAFRALLYIPLVFIGFQFMSNVLRMNTMGPNRLPIPTKSFSDESKKNIEHITFEDWAGSPEVLRECSEIVSFLKNRQQYETMGAHIPRGILLEGPPGTGKTLLAKAIACEAGADFISMVGSEFVEFYVGLGASRVRQLFQDASKRAPCIIFIDEIDAVGRQRGAGINTANDEREQTLNQLLAELDGFSKNENVIVIAATNRQDILDQALLRPGRFDRIVNVPLPDFSSRLKILEVHARTKPVDADVNLETIAQQTSGYSGAQLQNILNEAAILAVRKEESSITMQTISEALEKIIVGIQKETDTRGYDTKRRVAIHEAGHAVMALLFPQYFHLVKVTLQNTYSGAGGYTLFTDHPDVIEHGLYTREHLFKRLGILLAGRAAESLYYGNEFVSIGASEDLRQAALLSRQMIQQFGMGEQLENYCNPYDHGDNPFLGKMIGTGHSISEEFSAISDKEAYALVKDAYHETRKLLKENERLMNKVIDGLLTKNTLLKEDIV